MVEMEYSSLLKRVLELAKELGTEGSALITAEQFLIAVAQVLAAGPDCDEEVEDTASFIRLSGLDLQEMARSLRRRIEVKGSGPYLDGIHMQKYIYNAKHRARENGESVLTVGRLLACVLDDPPQSIRAELKRRMGGRWESGTEPVVLSGQTDDRAQENMDLLCPDPEEPGQDARAEIVRLVDGARQIRTGLQRSIFGQDNAIGVFTSGYFRACMRSLMDGSGRQPRATFLFAGPPGVGKTYLAESAARLLGLPFMRFDMSEYADKEANLEFCGSDKVYRNSKVGNVTDFVDKNPRSVLLFDEIEKAHLCVIHLFLQILDAGRLRDNHTDKEVSFSDTIIIMTTNAGRQFYEQSQSGDFSGVSRKVIIRALKQDINPETGAPFFPSAICSRFASGNVVMFNHMSARDLITIARREILRQCANLAEQTDIRVEVDDGVYSALVFSEGGAADARTIRARAEAFFNEELYELLRLVNSDRAATRVEDIREIRIGVDLSRAQAGIPELFVPARTPRALLLAGDGAAAVCGSCESHMDLVHVQDGAEAMARLKEEHFDLVLLDVTCGVPEQARASLNIEDVDSPARELFRALREHRSDMPVYLIQEREGVLNEEEWLSFVRQGARQLLCLARPDLAQCLARIASGLHQQASIGKLVRENKVVCFDTAQSICADGSCARIDLFDFRMTVAVDAEDSDSVLSAVSRPDVRFDDVIGAREAKRELAYFVEYLKDPQKYAGTGVKAPRGVILYGPPGTGKTMLARAMACHAGVTFIAAEGNQFLKKFVGEGAQRVHELFRIARKYAPSILFVDEIDAIGKERRGGEAAGATGEEVLTAFLTEMDGFASDPTKPVFVLAATNFDVQPGRPKSLDPALLRRFDRRVFIDLPDRADRGLFLEKRVAGNRALDISRALMDSLALRSTGMSLAELDSVVELALRSAIRENSTVVTDAILEDAFETFNNGEVRSWDASQLERVARHEAGHALISWLSGRKPSYITVVARGNHGGYMQQVEQEGKAIYTREELLARIRTALGGRAAEMVYYGERDGISTGAAGDLESASALARQIVCCYGMDPDFGLAVLSDREAEAGPGAPEVREAVNRVLNEQMDLAIRQIGSNRDRIDALVEQLLSRNHLNGDQLDQIFSTCGGAAHQPVC